jgi:hypothetical protein
VEECFQYLTSQASGESRRFPSQDAQAMASFCFASLCRSWQQFCPSGAPGVVISRHVYCISQKALAAALHLQVLVPRGCLSVRCVRHATRESCRAAVAMGAAWGTAAQAVLTV